HEPLRDLPNRHPGSGADVVHGAFVAVERDEAIGAHDVANVAEITHRIERADADLVAFFTLRRRAAVPEPRHQESAWLTGTGARAPPGGRRHRGDGARARRGARHGR